MPDNKSRLVPVPSNSVIPERDIDKTPILEARHLGIDFGGLTAVDDFNLTIGRTEIAGLIGPNGAGKTTIFNLLTKVYQPTRGTVLIDGIDTHNMSTIDVNKHGIARTFQNIRLFGSLTVEENVKIGMHNQIGYGTIVSPNSGTRKRSPMNARWSFCQSSICRIWQTLRPAPFRTGLSGGLKLSAPLPRTPLSFFLTSLPRE